MNTEYKIKKQEEKYRLLSIDIIQSIYSGCSNIMIEPTKYTAFTDVAYSAITNKGNIYTYDVEIKERNTDRFNNCILKVKKLERMQATRTNQRLLYWVFFNKKTLYVYDCDTIDWNKLPKRWTQNKVTEYNDNSEVIGEEIYLLPFDLAVYTCDCTKFYDKYNDL